MILLSLIAAGALAGSSRPQDGPEILAVGHWIEVRGALDESGRFVAEKVELKRPDDDLLIGTVSEDERDPLRFTLLGQLVEVDPQAEWKNLERGSLAGSRVEITGSWKGPRKLIAKTIATRGSGRDRLGSRIDELQRVEGGWEARLMIFTVFLPEGAEVAHEDPVASYPLAKERKVAEPSSERDTERNEDELFGKGISLGHDLSLSGQIEARPGFEDNFDLDDSKDQDREDYLFRFRTRLDWTPSSALLGRLELRYDQLWRDDERTGSFSLGNGFLGETFLSWRDAFGDPGLEVTVGRQKFTSQRRWIDHQNLDALRTVWNHPSWRLDLGVGTTLTDGSPRDEEAVDWLAYLSNTDRKEHLAAWALYRDIGAYRVNPITSVEEQNLHLGARAIGEFLPQNESWFDVAYLLGSREVNGAGARDIAAWGYDAGTIWTPAFAQSLYFTLGYALGTGDAHATGEDGNFRQTGLQDNKGKFGGVTSFKYYGELIDPELSNLGILTIGLGALLAEKTSLDLVYHSYTQDVAKNELSLPPVDSSLKRAALNGIDADIGSELDLILGYRRFASWDLELVGAWFHPGDAFSVGDDAYLAKLQLRYRF